MLAELVGTLAGHQQLWVGAEVHVQEFPVERQEQVEEQPAPALEEQPEPLQDLETATELEI